MTSLGSHTTVISDFSGDQRMLFKTVNKLVQKQEVKQYPCFFLIPPALRMHSAIFFLQ